MKRVVIAVAVAVPVSLLLWWVARNTEWADVAVPMPLQGEARTNPFYAAQRLAESLGSHSAWDRVFTPPPSDAVLVLSGWNWSLSTSRREAIKQWVESGGRLVVDSTIGSDTDFEQWSGIVHVIREWDEDSAEYEEAFSDVGEEGEPERCRDLVEEEPGDGSATMAPRHYSLCGWWWFSSLTTSHNPEWMLRDELGVHAVRVRVGQGFVTHVNGSPFKYRALLEGDHARVFVAATALRQADEVHFLSEDDHPSILALMWQYGSAIVVLALVAICLLLWRGGVRLGPPAAARERARRSLAEQIIGTGRFALRHGADALHAASVRALDEAAARRIPGYSSLLAKERGAALARLTEVDAHALLKATHHSGSRRHHELRAAITLLETARRLLQAPTHGVVSSSPHGRKAAAGSQRSSYGTD